MKYYFIAGESSGDLHAANCIRHLRELDPDAEFAFTGGELMERATGRTADVHISDMAFMGFVDVVKNIRAIRRNFKTVKRAITKFRPDLLVLVDYPGFNLRMAEWAHKHRITVDYYISPTVWAWKEGRVELIRKYVKNLFVILPFEEEFYRKHDMKVHFVGHPLLDAVADSVKEIPGRETFVKTNGLSGKPIIAVLPGSRKQELDRMLPIMLGVSRHFPEYEFVFAGSPTVKREQYMLVEQSGNKVVFGQTYALMKHAIAGIIKSGTSTLESALMGLPQVICYRGGRLSFAIGKKLVNISYIGLPNLIMNKPVVKELVQDDLNERNIVDELKKLTGDTAYRERILDDYRKLAGMLGGTGASFRLAERILKDAKSS